MDYRPERSRKPWFDQRVLASHSKRDKPEAVGFTADINARPRPLLGRVW